MVEAYVLLNRFIDLLLRPFGPLHPVVSLVTWSAVVGVAAMLIYKYASKQEGIRTAKERIKGHFFEVWLYIDDALVIARSQARIFLNALRYLGYALPPLIIMIVIFFPLFANFETRYAMRPVKPGGEVLVKLMIEGDVEGWQDEVSLTLPEGVEITAGPLRLSRRIMGESAMVVKSRRHEVDYKLSPKYEGVYELEFNVFDKTFSVPLVAGDRFGTRVSPYFTKSAGLALIYPPFKSIPGNVSVKQVEIKYPEASFPFPGWETWWVWPFLIISVVAAIAVKGVFKVEI